MRNDGLAWALIFMSQRKACWVRFGCPQVAGLYIDFGAGVLNSIPTVGNCTVHMQVGDSWTALQ